MNKLLRFFHMLIANITDRIQQIITNWQDSRKKQRETKENGKWTTTGKHKFCMEKPYIYIHSHFYVFVTTPKYCGTKILLHGFHFKNRNQILVHFLLAKIIPILKKMGAVRTSVSFSKFQFFLHISF